MSIWFLPLSNSPWSRQTSPCFMTAVVLWLPVLWHAPCSHLLLGPSDPHHHFLLSQLRQGFLTTYSGWAEQALTPNIHLYDTTEGATALLSSSHQCTICVAKLVNLININYKFSMQCIQFAWNESPINKVKITGPWSVMDETASLLPELPSGVNILLLSN